MTFNFEGTPPTQPTFKEKIGEKITVICQHCGKSVLGTLGPIGNGATVRCPECSMTAKNFSNDDLNKLYFGR